jgi:hypothetical protein
VGGDTSIIKNTSRTQRRTQPALTHPTSFLVTFFFFFYSSFSSLPLASPAAPSYSLAIGQELVACSQSSQADLSLLV